MFGPTNSRHHGLHGTSDAAGWASVSVGGHVCTQVGLEIA